MTDLIRTLCGLNGVSGRESRVRDFIIENIKDCCNCSVDGLGNIIAFKKGERSPRKKIMVDAHMDEVGFIATSITEQGFIRFSNVGGINTECVLQKRVVFENGTTGVIGAKPIHLLSSDEAKKLPDKDNLFIDIGACGKSEAESLVKPGDTAVFDSDFCDTGDLIISKAIDDRAGCAILIKLLKKPSEYDFYATFSVQEEVGARGAAAAAFSVAPDFCICLEATTAADIAGVESDRQVCAVGKGAAISFMDNGALYDRRLFEAALSCGVPCQVKSAVTGGNNSGSVHKTGSGIRTLAISVPCRYIHSSSCVAAKADIRSSLALAERMISVMGKCACDD